jgi:hypothetical protein
MNEIMTENFIDSSAIKMLMQDTKYIFVNEHDGTKKDCIFVLNL